MFCQQRFFLRPKHPYSHRFEAYLKESPALALIQFELATQSDVKELAELAKETYRETYPDYNPSDREKLLEARFGAEFISTTYFAELNSNQVKYFKATCGHKMLGFAKLIFQDNHIAKLDKLYVLKAYQRQKIGSSLMQLCFKSAAQENMSSMQLVIVVSNLNALAFYHKNGFYKTGLTFVPNIPNSTGRDLKNEILCCDHFVRQADLCPTVRNRGKSP